MRRKHVLQDTFRQMQQPNFNLDLKFNVRFIGEAGEDGGGPRREFFRLVLSAIASGGRLFCGPEGHRTPVRNALARQNGEFRMAGSLMALSVVQGGPTPSFLSDTMVQYLSGNKKYMQASIDQVPDAEIQEKLRMVHSLIIICGACM